MAEVKLLTFVVKNAKDVAQINVGTTETKPVEKE